MPVGLTVLLIDYVAYDWGITNNLCVGTDRPTEDAVNGYAVRC